MILSSNVHHEEQHLMGVLDVSAGVEEGLKKRQVFQAYLTIVVEAISNFSGEVPCILNVKSTS